MNFERKKHLLLENFLVYWTKEFPIKNIADSRVECDIEINQRTHGTGNIVRAKPSIIGEISGNTLSAKLSNNRHSLNIQYWQVFIEKFPLLAINYQ